MKRTEPRTRHRGTGLRTRHRREPNPGHVIGRNQTQYASEILACATGPLTTGSEMGRCSSSRFGNEGVLNLTTCVESWTWETWNRGLRRRHREGSLPTESGALKSLGLH